MFFPWQKRPAEAAPIAAGARPLMKYPGGGFPVPEAVRPAELPPAVRASVLRILEAPPKPAVSRAVMNEAQRSMISPDLHL